MRCRVATLLAALGAASALRLPFRRHAAPVRSWTTVVAPGRISASSGRLAAEAKEPAEKVPGPPSSAVREGVYAVEDGFLKVLGGVKVWSGLSGFATAMGERLDKLDERIQVQIAEIKTDGLAGRLLAGKKDLASSAAPDAEEERKLSEVVGYVENLVEELYFGAPASADAGEKTEAKADAKPVAPVLAQAIDAGKAVVVKAVTNMAEEAEAAEAAGEAALQADDTATANPAVPDVVKLDAALEKETAASEAVMASVSAAAEAEAEAAAAPSEAAEVAKPTVAKSSAEVVEAAPAVAKASTEVAEAEPAVAKSSTEVAEAEPTVAKSSTELAEAEPAVATSSTEVAETEPAVAKSSMETTDAEPAVAKSAMEVAGAEATVAEPAIAEAEPAMAVSETTEPAAEPMAAVTAAVAVAPAVAAAVNPAAAPAKTKVEVKVPKATAKSNSMSWRDVYDDIQTVGVDAVKAARSKTLEEKAEQAEQAEQAQAMVQELQPVIAAPEEEQACVRTTDLIKLPFRIALQIRQEKRTTFLRFWFSRIRRILLKVMDPAYLKANKA